MTSFTRKRLTAVFTLASGTFGSSGANTVTLPDPASKGAFRILASIEKAGGIAMGTARIRVYGLPASTMNQLTQLAFHPLQVPDNRISILAGEDDGQQSLAFSGTILSAWANYSGSPDVYLDVQAMTGYFNKLASVPPTSYSGSTDAALAMAQLAKQMGYAFENNGVRVSASNSYLSGSAMDQAQALAAQANVDLYVDDTVLAICPRGIARSAAGGVPLVSAETGLVGYPVFDKMGIFFRCLYNSAITFGGMVQIKSQVANANGQWRVVSIGHELESERPDGQWFSNVWVTDNAVALVP